MLLAMPAVLAVLAVLDVFAVLAVPAVLAVHGRALCVSRLCFLCCDLLALTCSASFPAVTRLTVYRWLLIQKDWANERVKPEKSKVETPKVHQN